MFRRLSQQTPASQYQDSDLSRSSTYTAGSRSQPASQEARLGGPRRDDVFNDLQGLSITDDPPPPSYQHALNASIAPTPVSSWRPAPVSQSRPTNSAAPVNSSTAPPSAPAASVSRSRSVEDPLASLSRFDISLVVDDSPSMHDLWSETRQALMGLVERTTKYDKDGVDLCFLNAELRLSQVTDSGVVREAFDTVVPSSGSTPTGFVLDDILRPYVERVEDAKKAPSTGGGASAQRIKPLIVIVVTDGRADDTDLVKDVLVEMADRLNDVRAPPYQLGIQFVQVGNDPDATAFLKELDDDLESARDMVDTVPFQGTLTAEWMLKTLLGSVTKRLDRTTV